MENIIKVGDVITCINNGGNNTSVGISGNIAKKGDGPFIIKSIHEGNPKFIYGKLNTLETECGKFLWNSTKYFKVLQIKNLITKYIKL